MPWIIIFPSGFSENAVVWHGCGALCSGFAGAVKTLCVVRNKLLKS